MLKKTDAPEPPAAFAQNAAVLMACFFGLQASYITWGIIQEYIMTRTYKAGKFPSAVFIVFSNRLTACLVALLVTVYKHGRPTAGTSLMNYFPSSLSNVLSSWGQYAALDYVSFPMQTLFKSSKIIPVMLAGKLLDKKKYPVVEYLEAVVITIGIGIFMIANKMSKTKEGGGKAGIDDSSPIGIAFLCLYVASDAFTSQWQSRVFKRNKQVDQFQVQPQTEDRKRKTAIDRRPQRALSSADS